MSGIKCDFSKTTVYLPNHYDINIASKTMTSRIKIYSSRAKNV